LHGNIDNKIKLVAIVANGNEYAEECNYAEMFNKI
jgi:hypothetical protein